MTWESITSTRKPRTAWNRRPGYELRLTAKTIGYLNANAREFLFEGKQAGMVRFEQEGDSGNMSIVPCEQDGLKVNKHGHVAISAITAQTAAPLPLTVLLTPFEDECRLLFSGVKR